MSTEDQVDGNLKESRLSRNSGIKYQIVCCQRCHQLLDVETNLHQLEEAIRAELSVETLKKPEPSKVSLLSDADLETDSSTDFRNRLRQAALEDVEDDLPFGRQTFVFSSDASDSNSERLKLMELLSDISTVDHPICTSCTDSVLEELESEISTLEKECVSYEYFLRHYSQDGSALNENSTEFSEMEEQLNQLQLEESTLKDAITEAETERTQLVSRAEELRREGQRIKVAEEDYYRERAKYDREIAELEDEKESVDYQLAVAEKTLDKLKKTNIFNLAFHIWHDDQFGTINGLRLGRLPGSPVYWPEINAAWGQTALLLHSLARKINLTFEKYRIVPFGSHAYVECLDDQNKKLPLYGDGGFKFFWDVKFDHAMAAFLDCLNQFKRKVEQSDAGYRLPYDIKPEQARIVDVHSGAEYSIRAQFNTVEQWTKALKFMLTNLKWGLAWVVSRYGETAE